MNTKILDYFIAIAEEKSITRAAERFFLTDSALSKHVRNMEKELGVPIFRYTREGMQLTAEGVVFINNAQAIRHLEREMERKLSDLDRRSDNTVCFAVDEAYYNCIVRDVMPVFQKEYPNCSLELIKCNASQARKFLLAEKADLGIISTTSARLPGLETLRVMTTRVYNVFPPGYPAPDAPDAVAVALAEGLMPVLHPVGSTIRMMEEQRLAEMNLIPQNFLEGNYWNALHDILNGTGFSFLPEGICETFRHRGLAIGGEFMQHHSMIVYLPNRVFSDECRALMEMVLRIVSGGGLLTPYRAGRNSFPSDRPGGTAP